MHKNRHGRRPSAAQEGPKAINRKTVQLSSLSSLVLSHFVYQCFAYADAAGCHRFDVVVDHRCLLQCQLAGPVTPPEELKTFVDFSKSEGLARISLITTLMKLTNR